VPIGLIGIIIPRANWGVYDIWESLYSLFWARISSKGTRFSSWASWGMRPLIRSANWSCLAWVAAFFSNTFSSCSLFFSAIITLLSSALDLRVVTRAFIAIRSKVITFFFFSASACLVTTLYACSSSVKIRRLILWRASVIVIRPPFCISLLPTLLYTLRRFLAASESLISLSAWAPAYTRDEAPLIKEYKYSFTSSGRYKVGNTWRSSEAW
jgi:hypothetical protein